jgi:hypothetical protein
MIFFRIALFIFITQLVAGLVQVSAGDFGFGYNPLNVSSVDQATVQQAENLKNNIMPSESASTTDPIAGALGWFYKQITNAAQQLFSSAFPLISTLAWMPMMLIALHVPATWAWALFSVLTIIEVLGLIEFISGRSLL